MGLCPAITQRGRKGRHWRLKCTAVAETNIVLTEAHMCEICSPPRQNCLCVCCWFSLSWNINCFKKSVGTFLMNDSGVPCPLLGVSLLRHRRSNSYQAKNIRSIGSFSTYITNHSFSALNSFIC